MLLASSRSLAQSLHTTAVDSLLAPPAPSFPAPLEVKSSERAALFFPLPPPHSPRPASPSLGRTCTVTNTTAAATATTTAVSAVDDFARDQAGVALDSEGHAEDYQVPSCPDAAVPVSPGPTSPFITSTLVFAIPDFLLVEESMSAALHGRGKQTETCLSSTSTAASSSPATAILYPTTPVPSRAGLTAHALADGIVAEDAHGQPESEATAAASMNTIDTTVLAPTPTSGTAAAATAAAARHMLQSQLEQSGNFHSGGNGSASNGNGKCLDDLSYDELLGLVHNLREAGDSALNAHAAGGASIDISLAYGYGDAPMLPSNLGSMSYPLASPLGPFGFPVHATGMHAGIYTYDLPPSFYLAGAQNPPVCASPALSVASSHSQGDAFVHDSNSSSVNQGQLQYAHARASFAPSASAPLSFSSVLEAGSLPLYHDRPIPAAGGSRIRTIDLSAGFIPQNEFGLSYLNSTQPPSLAHFPMQGSRFDGDEEADGIEESNDLQGPGAATAIRPQRYHIHGSQGMHGKRKGSLASEALEQQQHAADEVILARPAAARHQHADHTQLEDAPAGHVGGPSRLDGGDDRDTGLVICEDSDPDWNGDMAAEDGTRGGRKRRRTVSLPPPATNAEGAVGCDKAAVRGRSGRGRVGVAPSFARSQGRPRASTTSSAAARSARKPSVDDQVETRPDRHRRRACTASSDALAAGTESRQHSVRASPADQDHAAVTSPGAAAEALRGARNPSERRRLRRVLQHAQLMHTHSLCAAARATLVASVRGAMLGALSGTAVPQSSTSTSAGGAASSRRASKSGRTGGSRARGQSAPRADVEQAIAAFQAELQQRLALPDAK